MNLMLILAYAMIALILFFIYVLFIHPQITNKPVVGMPMLRHRVQVLDSRFGKAEITKVQRDHNTGVIKCWLTTGHVIPYKIDELVPMSKYQVIFGEGSPLYMYIPQISPEEQQHRTAIQKLASMGHNIGDWETYKTQRVQKNIEDEIERRKDDIIKVTGKDKVSEKEEL